MELLQNVVSRDVQKHWSTFCERKLRSEITSKQRELRVKQQEQENQQQMMKAMILQQQEMNNAFLTVVKKLLDK